MFAGASCPFCTLWRVHGVLPRDGVLYSPESTFSTFPDFSEADFITNKYTLSTEYKQLGGGGIVVLEYFSTSMRKRNAEK